MSEDSIAYKCPYCRTNDIQTSAKLPYVRGFLLAVQHGHKQLVGCNTCVRTELLKESGKSALIGWFSPTALILNPIFIVYGLGRALFVRTNLEAVRKVLKEAGIPEPAKPLNLVQVAYSLAASMIAADKKIKPEEIALASEIGTRILEGFDAAEFRKTVDNHKNLPEPAELAGLLREVLTEDGRVLVYRYLLAIAQADEEVSQEEMALLALIADKLGLAPADGQKAAA
jgi:uncharacterized tellurite resistance protein B-like protein